CSYGIDLHTAAQRRTNFPHVRADLSIPEVAELARWFGCEVIADRKGDERSLRQVACDNGCFTIILEAGEALPTGRGAVGLCVRGVKRAPMRLRMLRGKRLRPDYQPTVKRSVWVRAQWGWLLRLQVAPGSMVGKDAVLATCEGFFREES